MTGFTASAMRRVIAAFCTDESATTAIEYALVAAGVALAIITTVFTLGSNLKETWWDKVAAIFS
jgi:pilus assembly protein Flp/PilA